MDKNKCKWEHDQWHNYYETGCGHIFGLVGGTPAENNMKFCPYCGKRIKVIKEKKYE